MSAKTGIKGLESRWLQRLWGLSPSLRYPPDELTSKEVQRFRGSRVQGVCRRSNLILFVLVLVLVNQNFIEDEYEDEDEKKNDE